MFRKFTLTAFVLIVLALRLSAQVTAGFSIIAPVPNCNPAVYSFINSSTGGTPPLTYQWNFGVYPGINSIFQDPSTTYIGCGTFTVKLFVTDALGAQDSSTQDITVRCSPSANFSTNTLSGCVPFNASLLSSSIPGSGSIVNYLWDFGDGYSGGGISPNHIYTEPGCKNITLIVKNTYDCVNDTTITNLLCTYNPPIAGFASTPTSSCSAPFDVTYQDTSSSGLAPYTYQWIFDGGTPATSTDSTPTVTYNAAGSFTTTLITTDVNGCTDTIVKPGYVNIANNTADFTLSSVNGCAPATITTHGLASSTPIGWHWQVTPLASVSGANSQNGSFTFSDTGTYTICLTIDYGGGCTAQKCSTVVIHTAPIADFNISGLLNTCIKPNAITFTDSSTGSNLSYNWSFPGGSPSSANTSTPPAISYGTCGSYSASLIVTDDFGCTATKTASNYLNITCPQASFTVAPRGGCTPLTSTFNSTASTGNPVSWLWIFGDSASGTSDSSASQNPSHVFNNTGCYTVTLITTNAEGCTATYTIPQAVCAGNKPVASFNANPNITCANEPFQFINTSTGTNPNTTYQWDFTHTPPNFNNGSNQKDPSHIYEDTGFFNVALIVSNYGCNDTIVMDDAVEALPPVAVPTLTRNCSNHFVVTLNGTGSLGAMSYLWNIPGGNPSSATTPTVTVTYTSTGNYTASLFVYNDSTNCNDIQSINIPIRDVHAGFTGSPLAGCSPLSSCMSNTSVDETANNWYLLNSSGTVVATSTSTSPCWNITTPGIYSVRLIATDMFGCKDTLYRPNYITVYKPTAAFIGAPLNGCVPLTVNFTDQSTTSTSTVTGWSWNFGDPTSGADNTSTLQNPAHVYNHDGFYTVSLTVTDDHGCSTTLTRTNYVHANKPAASFNATYAVICQGTQECFNNTSTGTGLTYRWDFGDGGTSTATNPCHVYTTTGNFTIQLIVTDATGCIDTATKTNYVSVTMPHAAFVADTTLSFCPPLQVRFTNLSSDTDSHTTYLWKFGDGQVSSAREPQHIYNIAGLFTVTLIVTNQNGCKDTLTFPNYIHIGGPTAYISVPPTSGCVPHYTCLEAVSASTISYTWNFGDGTVAPGTDSICYTYTRTGTFYTELILNDGAGCIYAMPAGVITVGGAVANFTMDKPSLCQSGTVQFADSSFGTSAIISRTWDFGDSASGAQNTATRKHPSHFYATSGVYTVTLNITTSDSCTNSISKTVTVSPVPQVSFAISDSSVCPPDSVFFTDQTTSASPVVSILWNFDDPASGTADTSSLQNPAHYYTIPGNYTVTLTEQAANGCSNSYNLPVTVHSPVVANAVSPVSICVGGSMLLSASGGTSYSWTPATGLSNTGIATPVASPAVTTTYTVVVSSVFGCTGQDTVVVNVNPVPVISTITGTPDTCGVHGAKAFVTATGGTPVYAYAWNTSPIQTDSFATGLNGGSTYAVVVTDINGCTASNNISIINLPAPVVSVTGTPTTCGYSNGTVTANVTAVNLPYTFNWNTSSTQPSLSNIAAGNYSVVVTDNLGCTGTGGTTIINIPGPAVTPTATNATCGFINGKVKLIVSGGTSPFAYHWSNGATTKNISGLNAGTYSVTVTDANGCTAITADSLVVIPPPVLTFTQINATCGKYNASIDVTVTAGTTPYTYSWNNGAYNTEDLSNVHSGTYHVTMTDANHCVDTATIVITDTPFPILGFAFTPSTCGHANGAIDLTVSSGVPPFTYTWDNGATTEDLSNISAGSYHIIVNSANGCFADTSVALNNINGAVLTPVPKNNTCGLINGAINVNLTGGVSPFTFSWSNGSTTQNISALATGVYLLTVMDGNGCLSNTNATLVNIPGPSLLANPVTATCSLPNGNVNLSLTNGTAPFVYVWSNGATTQNNTNVAGGTYAVTVTDANACVDSTSASVGNINGPTLNGSSQSSTCGNSNGATSLTVNGGTAPYSFSWNSGAFTTQDLTNITAGNYNVQVTDSNNCLANLSLVVTNITGPTLALNSTNTTCGNANGSINLTVTGGTSPFTYNWNNGAYTTQNITNISIGTYTVAVTDSNGCVTMDSTAVNNTTGPTLDTTTVNATCGLNNAAINLLVTGGTSPFSFYWNNGSTTQNISALAPGLYNATVTDSNSCQTNIGVIVSSVAGPFSNLTPISSVCGNSNGSVNVSVSGGTGPFTFNWSNGATTQNITALAAGTYHVTITDASGCQVTDSTIVNNINGPTASASTVNSSCGNDNGQVYSLITGGTSPIQYLWNTGDITPDLNYIAAGNYSLTVTDANGCTSATSALVSNISGPSALIITGTQSTCGNANALATSTVSGGVAPYQYNWSTTPAQNGDTAFNLLGGNTYALTVTDANNCTTVNSVAITNIPGLVLSDTHANCTCATFNGTIDLTVNSITAPFTYNWSNGATTEDLTGLSPAIYSVTVTDSNGCKDTLSVNVINIYGPYLSHTTTNTTCGNSNGAIDETVSGGTSPFFYNWNSGTYASQDLTNIAAGNYILQLQDGAGCQVSDTVVITNTTGPALNIIGTNSTCGNSNGSALVKVTGGTAPFIYNWNNAGNSIDSFANALAAGTYSVNVSDSNGCVTTDSVIINNTAGPTVVATATNATCGLDNGSVTITLTGGTAPFTYSWNSGLYTTKNISGLAPNTYFAAITDSNGCQAFTAKVLHSSPAATLDTVSLNATCGLTNGSITVSATGGTAPYAYSWNNGATAQNLSNLGGGRYILQFTEASGCTQTDTFNLTSSNNAPVVTAVPTQPVICTTGSTTINAAGANTYTWAPAAGLSATTGATVTAHPAVTTTYTVIGSVTGGCADTVTVVITLQATPAVIAATGNPNVCSGHTDTLTASGALTYKWSPSATLNSSTGAVVISKPVSNITYTITGTDNIGCTATTTVSLIKLANPTIQVSPDNPVLCEGNGVVMSATGALNYTWTPAFGLNQTTGASVTATPTISTTYTIIGTDINGCADTALNIASAVNPAPVDAGPGGTICPGGSYQLQGSGAVQYAWSPATGLNSVTSANPIASPTITTTYYLHGYVPTGQLITNGDFSAGNVGFTSGYTYATDLQPEGLYWVGPSPHTVHPNFFCSDHTTGTGNLMAVNGAPTPGVSIWCETINVVPNSLYDFSTWLETISPAGNPALLQFSINGNPLGSPFAASATLCNWQQFSTTWNSGSNTTADICIVNQNTVRNGNDFALDDIKFSVLCDSYDSVVVVVNPAPVITAIPANDSLCKGSSTTVTASGASTYKWKPSTGLSATTGSTVTANPNATTTYTITGTNASGCTGSTTLVLHVLPKPALTISSTSPSFCSGGTSTLTASGALFYTWTPATGLNTTSGATVAATPNATTTYSVAGTDVNGCTNAATSIVTVYPLPNLSVSPSSTTICTGSSTNLTASGAASYAWSPNIAISATSGANVSVNPIASITYTVIGTSIHGCTADTTAPVTIGTGLTLTITPDSARICPGNSTLLTASGATNYTWTPSFGLNNTTGSTVAASPASTTTYIITGIDAAGCSGTTSAVVRVNRPPLVSVSPSNPAFCVGDSTLLVASGAFTYTWLPAVHNLSTDSAMVKPATSTTYTVIGSDANGCTAKVNVPVDVFPLPALNITAAGNFICFGGNTTLNASGADDYQWAPAATLSSPSGASVSAFPSANTTYTVIGTSATGCQAIDSVSVKVGAPVAISVDPVNPTICAGSVMTLHAYGAKTYQWSPSTGLTVTTGSSIVASPIVNTTYTVVGIDSNGCSGFNAIVVNLGTFISLTLHSNAPAICKGDTTTLTVSGAVNYNWSPVSSLNDSTGASVIASPATSTTYHVTGIDAVGCTGAGNVSVTVNPLPTIVATPDSVITCAGSSALLTATGGINYVWSPSTYLSSTTGSTVTVTPLNNISYVVAGFDANGCSNKDSVLVLIKHGSPISVSPIADTICSGQSTILTATGAVTYTWTPATGLDVTTGSTVIATPSVTTKYFVTGTDSGGCQTVDSSIILVHHTPVLAIGGSSTICTGTSTVLTASGALTYTWSPAGGLSATTGASVIANPAVNSTYIIQGTDTSGCSNFTTATVTLGSGLTIIINPDSAVICRGDAVTLTANGAANFTWSPATGLSASTGSIVTANPLVTTTYTVTGTNTAGCSGDTTFVVTVNTRPVVTVNSDSICAGNTALLIASGGANYSWLPDSTNNDSLIVTPAVSTTYTVIGTNASGCSNSALSVVTVSPMPVIDMEGLGSDICLSASPVSISVMPEGGIFKGPGIVGDMFFPKLAGVGGPYTITYTFTTPAGCTDSAQIFVTVHPGPNLVITPNNPAICLGNSATLSVSGAAFYNWFPIGVISAFGDSMTVTPNATTTYYVTGKDTLGCKTNDSAIVNVHPIPVVSFTGLKPVYCLNNPAEVLTGIPAGGTFRGAGITGNIFNAQAAGAGTFTIYYSYADPIGCPGVDSQQVTVKGAPNIFVGNADICAGLPGTISAFGADSYVWMPGNLTGADVVISPSVNTTYTIIGTNVNGCADTTTSIVTVNALPVVSFSGLSLNYCSAATAVTLTGSPAGGTFSGTGVTGNTFDPSSAGIGGPYTVTYTYTDSVYCSNHIDQTVNINSGATIVAIPTSTTICPGTSTTINVSGGVSYSWSPATGLSNTTGSTVIANPSANTTYVVSGTDANGCTGSDTVAISIGSNLTIQLAATGSNAICKGSSTTLIASGATQFVWSPSTGLSSSTGTSVTASPLVTTTYTVTGSISAGCSGDTTIVITVNNPPVITVNNPTICAGTSATLTAGGASSYTWLPVNVSGNSIAVSPSVNTTYTVTGANSNGCTIATTSVVTVNPTPAVTFSGLNPNYCGAATPVTLTGVPAGGRFSGAGISGNTFYPAQAGIPGHYVITYSYTSLSGCADSLSKPVNVNNGATVNVTPSTGTICFGSSSSLAANGAVNYLWKPKTGLNIDTGAEVIAHPAVTTTYTVTGTDANACTGAATALITLGGHITLNISSPNSTICAGDSTTLNVSGATTYAWLPATGLSSATGASVNASPAVNTTYTITGLDAGGCSGTGNAVVTVNPSPVVKASTNKHFVCHYFSATLTATGANNYTWSPSGSLSASSGNSVIATPLVNTTYTLTGTNASGCASSDTVSVKVDAPILLNMPVADATICEGASVPLTISGAASYKWSPATGLNTINGPSVIANPTSSVTYTITATSAKGCNAATNATVTVNPLPVINATSSSTSVCTGNVDTLKASGASSYSWVPNTALSATSGNNIVAQPVSSITYTVSGVDVNGCSNTAQVPVMVNPNPVITLLNNNPAICPGATINLNATGAASYSWLPATGLNTTTGSIVSANPSTTTTYTVTGTDANGCSATGSSIVTIHPIPVITLASSDSIFCFGQSATLTASGASSYSWSPNIGLSGVTGTSVIASPTANVNYLVLGTDSFGCNGNASIVLQVNPLPVININPNNPIICSGNSVSLDASGAINYSWSPAAGLSATTGNQLQASPSATSTYTVTGSDGNGCSATATTLVTVGGSVNLSVSPSNPSLCVGQSSTLSATGANTYTWTPAVGLNTTTGATVIATPPYSVIYTLVGSNTGGCADTISVSVVLNEKPVADAGPDAEVCKGGGTTLSASGGATYLWTPYNSLNADNISNPLATPNQTTTYVVLVTNGAGCSAADTIVVTVHQGPVANAGNDTAICNGGNANLHGSEGVYYRWVPADFLTDPQISSPISTPAHSITYTLTVTDAFGCSSQDSVQIFLKMPLNIHANPGATICSGGVVQLFASGGITYLWSPPTGLDNPHVADPFASPDQTTTYTVTSTDGTCFSAVDTTVVTVNQAPEFGIVNAANATYGQNIQLHAYGNTDFTWSPPDFLSCTDCPNPTVEHINRPMTYTVTATSPAGCRSEDTIHISLACNDDVVYIPDAFTPNGDNKNDVFRIRTYGLQHITAFRVFNRWGEMVFETSDVNEGWDGTYKGQICSPAVYDWYLEGTCSNGDKVLRKGNVTLIR